MAVPTQLSDLNVTIGSNPPAGTDSTGSPGQIDNYLRAAYGLLAQVNAAKAPIASPTFTGTVVLPTTTQIGEGSEGDTVSGTELGYVNGVTRAIQTQLNEKAPIASPTFTGTVSIPTGEVTSGTYTPTLADVANTSSRTASVCQYMRVGSVVTVSGKLTANCSAASLVAVSITLPIASTIGEDQQISGTGRSGQTGYPLALIKGAVGAAEARCYWTAPATGSTEVFFHFTYLIS